VTDGQGGIQLLALLQQPQAASRRPRRPHQAARGGEETDALRLLRAQAQRAVVEAPLAAARGARDAVELWADFVRRPWAGARRAAEFGRSLQRVLAPPSTPQSPLLARGASRGTSKHWTSRWKTSSERAGRPAGSLNDAYIARCSEASAATTSGSIADRRASDGVPISLRSGDHPMGGNRFAGARFSAPVGVEDPAERIRNRARIRAQRSRGAAIDALGSPRRR